MTQDPRISVTLWAAVGLGWPEDGVVSSHRVASRSSDFSRKKEKREILDFCVKSLDVLMSSVDLIFGKTLCRPNNIYFSWMQPTDDSYLNFASIFALFDFCLGYCQVSAFHLAVLTSVTHSLGWLSIEAVVRLTLTSKWSDTENRQDSVWLLSLCITARLKCFCQMLVLGSPGLFWRF